MSTTSEPTRDGYGALLDLLAALGHGLRVGQRHFHTVSASRVQELSGTGDEMTICLRDIGPLPARPVHPRRPE